MAPVRRELAALFRLSWPLVLSQVGMMLFGLVDIWMVGRLGARELAAVALADIVMFGSLITGIGLVMGIDPVVTQAHGAGAGVATGATRTLMMVALFAYIFLRGLHRGAWTPWSRAVFKWDRFKQLLGYGWPVALHLGLEVGAFGASGLMAGWLGATATAAHVVVLRLASFAFMLPLGISMAAATRVGNLLGARDRPGAQRAAWVALSVGAGAMCVSAACFLLFPEVLVRFFNDEAAVVANALLIFPIAAAFQVFDGTQVVGGSILRGMGTPRPAALINLLGYYGLAIPLGYWLAFKAGLDLAGVWWGLALGLMAVALAMVGWIAVRGPARVKELAIAEPEA